jgi:hypothetical protein
MSSSSGSTSESSAPHPRNDEPAGPDSVCPVCGAKLISEKCKVVCRSERYGYRLVFNCAEF